MYFPGKSELDTDDTSKVMYVHLWSILCLSIN